jgi:zinc protease
LLAAGPSSLSAIEGAAAPLFGAWRPSKTTQRERKVTLAAPARNTVYVLDRPNAVQTALFVAGAAPRKYEPGHEARQVLNNLFGGLFTSRLNQNLREKNAYTYGAFSTFMGTRDFGFWAASTSVRTDSSEQALTEIFAEWQRLATPEGIEQAEIARAQTDLVFKVAADLEHTSALLDELEEIFVYELAADHYSNVTSALKAVTAAELALQLPHIPGGSGSVVAVVGAQSKLGDLSKFGLVRPVGLQWLDGGE